MSQKLPKIAIIVGPTASGKSEMAVRLAETIGGEIINADSVQVYRELEIGSAKPSPELRRRVPHHLLDLVPPDEGFTAADFRRHAARAIEEIHGRGAKPVVVGGTGLYIRALLQGLADSPSGDEEIRHEMQALADREGNQAIHRRLQEVDPETAARLHVNDRVRIIRALEVYFSSGRRLSEFQREHGFAETPYRHCVVGIQVEREELYRRIDRRVDEMMEQGLITEVERLLAKGYLPDLKPLRSLGYKEICRYLAGEFPLEEGVRLIKRNTRHYAKRQLTWFKNEPSILWVEYPANFDSMCTYVMEFFG